MRSSRLAVSLACLAMLSACGGGGGGSFSPSPSPTPSPSPSSGTGGCSLSARQDFVRDVLNEWYLFPELLDTSVNKANYSDLQSYVDALVAPARAQNKDRYFTYVTSIAEETAFANSGATAGFGFRLSYDTANRRVFVAETYEGTAALAANLDRGTEILGIGTTTANIQTVNALMASGGAQAVVDALGPSTAGTTRVLQVRDQTGATRTLSVTKTDYLLDPVSDRYGARIINDNGRQVGYLNLRTFSILSAEQDLNQAFAQFRAAGVTDLVIDFRYNGGGRISVAERLGDLLGRALAGQVFDRTVFRPSKAANNQTYVFAPNANSVALTRIAFLATRSTASASELVINGMRPYVSNIALVGDNTFGKPVGQSAFDLSACDLRFRAVTFKDENAAGYGDFFNGLAADMQNTCRAADDLTHQLGDPNETMLRVGLDYIAGRSCTRITSSGISTSRVEERGLLSPELSQRNAAQHENPGQF